MQEYLTLTIQNAKRFYRFRNKEGKLRTDKNGKISKDCIMNFDNKPTDRTVNTHRECLSTTLLQTSVANILRVLCGERPIPANRQIRTNKTFNTDKFFDELAFNAKIKHLNAINKYGNSETEVLITHPWIGSLTNFMGKPIDIYNPSPLALSALTWDRLIAKLKGKEHIFSLILELAGVSVETYYKHSVFDVFKKIHRYFMSKSNEEQENVLSILKENKVTPLIILIKDGGDSAKPNPGDVGSWLKTAKGQELWEVKRPEKITADDYEVYIPINNEQKKQLETMLKRGCGFASCMEGGLVRLGLKSGNVWKSPIQNRMPDDCVGVEKNSYLYSQNLGS